MKIKMIVCDLDKTLLRTDKTLSAYTLEVLKKCRDSRERLLAYATARPKIVASPFADVTKPDIIISDNGALARMGDDVIHRAVLPRETVDKILHILQSKTNGKPGFITASTDHGLLINYDIDPNDEGWADWQPIYTDFSAGIDYDLYKISPEISDAGMLDEIITLPGITYTPYFGENWGTITIKGVTKWQAIQKVAEHLNIDIKHIVAFGDDFGDIEMIKGCGIGVAVGNAIPEAKAAADYICESNDDDGVARWLEEKILC